MPRQQSHTELPENDINYEPSIEVSEEQPSLVAADGPVASAPADENPSIVAPASAQRPPKPARADEPPAGPGDLADAEPGERPAGQADPDEPDSLGPAAGGRSRAPQHRLQPAGQWMRPGYGRANSHYSRQAANLARLGHHGKQQQQFEAPPLDEYGDEAHPAAPFNMEAEYQPARRPLYAHSRSNRRGPPGAFVDSYRPRGRQAAGTFGAGSPMASLDHDQSDEYAPGAPDELNGAYAAHRQTAAGLDALYAGAEESSAFNQIQATGTGLASMGQRARANARRLAQPGATSYLQQANMLRARQQAARNRGQPVAAEPGAGPMVPLEQTPLRVSPASTNSLACADCQPATRRLSFKQFCHLDFAIKATILARHMADDWTRFEVEIEDIFRSPSSSLLLLQRSRANNYVMEAIQKSAEFAPGEALSASASASGQRPDNGTQRAPLEPAEQANDERASLMGGQEQQQPQLHRSLKVGGLQSIWIPTEDVACKCPRLKLRSSYLLMGKSCPPSAGGAHNSRPGAVQREWPSFETH